VRKGWGWKGSVGSVGMNMASSMFPHIELVNFGGRDAQDLYYRYTYSLMVHESMSLVNRKAGQGGGYAI
jgi:hypothetical protein